MFTDNLFSSTWCDQIFEGRNKAYGAYALRKKEGRNSLIALISTLLMVFLLGLILLSGRVAGDSLTEELARPAISEKVVEILLPPKMPEAETRPKTNPAPKGNENSSPVIVKDQEIKKSDSLTIAEVPFKPGNPKGDSQIIAQVVSTIKHNPPGGGNPKPAVVIPTVNFASQMPEFPGGELELSRYMAKHAKYTKTAIDNDISGKVYVEFIVNANGKVSDARLVRGLGFGLDENSIQAIANMPDWIPGNQNGQAVNVRLTMPVVYRLNNK